ncbi:hypothetical protein PI124_g16076 [Phytophthora idaei]|nr:hypothetical protein PI125_g16265 [Phytophthora idaei]KAG3141877.1 hypothetical protein PI126_g15296 [Phytophthora idaei]KAG3238972.1 hypothetical protein PI124_g16076 [Phytophthora idaei]
MKTDPIKTAANFDSKGVKMEVCPSGDCKNDKFMRLTVASLTELDAKGTQVSPLSPTASSKETQPTQVLEARGG